MKRLVLAAVLAATIGVAGFAVADDMAPAPYFVIEAQAVGMDVVGMVPEGLRLDGHSRGVVAEGLLVGATTVGVDYLVFRHDGVGVIDARYFVADEEGVTVAMTLRGFIGEPMPGLLEAMLDPEFEFADVSIPLHGAAWLQTMAPQYAYLNHTVFGFDGTINYAEGAIRMSFRPLAP